MTEHAGCRISKVRPKHGGADIVMLLTDPKDTRFIRTLVWVLREARRGNVRSYAMVFRVEMPDGTMKWIEASDIAPQEDGGDLSMILGGITRMTRNLIERVPDDGDYVDPVRG